jgi:hypothetical protein
MGFKIGTKIRVKDELDELLEKWKDDCRKGTYAL